MTKRWRCEWTARGGALQAAKAGGSVFVEDKTDSLHGVVATITAPPASQGLGLRVRLRDVARPSCTIWARRVGCEDAADAIYDFAQCGAMRGRVPSADGAMHVEIAELHPGAYDLWFSLREHTHTGGYRVELLSRCDAEGSSKYLGDGRAAFVIDEAQAAAPGQGLLQLHAAAEGFVAEANLASVPQYYGAFFTEEKLQRVLEEKIEGPPESSAQVFERLMRESSPPARLRLSDMSAKWLADGDDPTLKLDMTAEDLVAVLGDAEFRRRLRDARSLRAAIVMQFPSDRGVNFLRAVLAAEADGGGSIGLRTVDVLTHSPRLLASALFSAAGLFGANAYLARLGANRFCFDPMVLTRPYTESIGAPMARVGLLLLDLRRSLKGSWS